MTGLRRRIQARLAGDDAGFGLTEIMVSLMLLGILAVSFAPLMIGALSASARNAAMTTATQLANQQIERARGSADSCTSLKNFLSIGAPAAWTDAQGRTYTYTQTPGSAVTCPATGAVLVTYAVQVNVTGPSAPTPVRIQTQIWTVAP